MAPESRKAAVRALVVTLVLGALIVVGSRKLAHFDAALAPTPSPSSSPPSASPGAM